MQAGADRNHTPPLWLWLWIPPLLVPTAYLLKANAPEAYRIFLLSETGVVELLTPVLLLCAVYYAAQGLRQAGATRGLHGWLLFLMAGCIYFAGEETSWGQHLFAWQTPELFLQWNRQGETNLHNINSWFNQKPRLLLELWVLLAAVIAPICGRLRRGRPALTRLPAWFWPGRYCIPAAVLAIAVKLPERIKDLFGLPPYPNAYEVRVSELQECYFALLLLLYLQTLYYSLLQDPEDPATGKGSGGKSGTQFL